MLGQDRDVRQDAGAHPDRGRGLDAEHGFMLLGEHVSLVDLAGIVPVALGIYLVTRPAETA